MEKRVFAKFNKLHNVVGRVDYISNPKRQENLLGFYQTPEDPAAFWRALSQVSQDQAQYNKAQIEEHNRLEKEKFEAGEIKTKHLWSTIEARENILCLPNDVREKFDPNDVAKFLAEDIKARFNVECAVGVHLNKKGTNYHAHIIMPERRMLSNQKVSVATRNTYFDSEGKRSNKKDCVDQNGDLKPGCRMVRKGEVLHQRGFSEKDPRFSAKGFAHSEKLRFAEVFNQWSKDTWVVYNHRSNPHLRLMDIKKGEPERLTAWKEYNNAQNTAYNETLDRLIETQEITNEQALAIKKRIYQERRENKQKRLKERERWIAGKEQRAPNTYVASLREDGSKRGWFSLLVNLAVTVAGYEQDSESVLLDSEGAEPIRIYHDKHLQNMVDALAHAAGRKSATDLMAEKKVLELAADEKNAEEEIETVPEEDIENAVEEEIEGVAEAHGGTMQQNNRLEDLIGAALTDSAPREPRSPNRQRFGPDDR